MKPNWKQASIGRACDVINGGTPDTGVGEYWDGTIPWITPAEMGRRITPYVEDTKRRLTESGLRDSSAKMLPPHSIILSSRAPIGHLVINKLAMATNQGCKGLVPHECLHYKYLYYYLCSIRDTLNALGTGATFRELSASKLKEITIPLPSLSKQVRIAGILDEAFEKIDFAGANAEESISRIADLFDSILLKTFASITRGYRPKYTLESLCELIVDCEHKTAPTQERGIPSIRTPNVGRGELLLDGVYRVSETTYEAWTRRARPQPGDLILAREAPAGNIAVIPRGLTVCLGQRTVLIRPDRKKVDPQFLAFLILQREMQAVLLASSRGATVRHVNMKDIRALGVGDLPSISEQQAVASKVQRLLGEAKLLQPLYKRKQAALERLKESMLHAAFNGEL